MIILGISGSPNTNQWSCIPHLTPDDFHDSSATLVIDGEVVAAFEEERFSRIKHSNQFPVNAIEACLLAAGVTYEDVDYFTFSTSEQVFEQILKGSGIDVSPREFIQLIMKKNLDQDIDINQIKFYDHHFSHAAGSLFHSGFNESLILTLDAQGDGLAGSIYSFSNRKFSLLRSIAVPDSLGFYYTHFTEFLGFSFFDEYKIMGLAPYGNPDKYEPVFKKFYSLLPNGAFELNSDNFGLIEEVCSKRDKNSELLQVHKDIAASLQKSLEVIVFHVVKHFQKETEHKNLCLSGGVALNGKLSGELLYSNLFEGVFVHPAASDNGLSMGTSLACYYEETAQLPVKLSNLYYGSDNLEEEKLQKELSLWQEHLNFEKYDNICQVTAGLIAEDKIIGWVQGKSEFGPRALGNRSILADPRPAKNKERVNSIVKMREGFRPFAPSLLEEFVEEYFVVPKTSKMEFPYMTFVLKVKEKYRSELGAVTHIDGSARLQTVSRSENSKYWRLIDEFRKITGAPILLNTSFNNNVEPIVDSVSDSIQCFLTNKLDCLIIDDYLITKNERCLDDLTGLSLDLFSHIALDSNDAHFEIINLYSGKKLMISKAMNGLIRNKSINQPISSQLKNEIINLWMLRFIKISPSQQPQEVTT